MNKEELIGKLQMVYVGDKNALNEMIGYYDGLKQGIEELQQENKELKKQLEEYKLQNINLRADIMIKKMAMPNELIKDKTFYDLYDMPTYEDLLNQQKEFIEYMNKTIEELECDDFDDEEMKGYLIQRIDTFKEILSKYKKIIGNNEQD